VESGGTLKLNPSLLLLSGCAAALLVLLIWILRDPRKSAKPRSHLLGVEDFERRHVTYFPQVRQALAEEDFGYLAAHASLELSRSVRKDRRKVVLAYLSFLRNDFLKLWRLAKVIAALSPKVGASQEFERLRLGLVFYMHYGLIRFKFQFGFSPVPELGSLNEMVSCLAIRLETAMNELGERAAAASKFASALDGRHLNTP
jgi:hypothetical protein